MARLPIIGGDNDGWGSVLNTYLQVSHNDDGTLKESSFESALPYKSYIALLSQSYPGITSGPLLLGHTYRIDTLLGSDDFTNIGFVTEGVEFLALETTPTVWTSNTVLYLCDLVDTVIYNNLGFDIFWRREVAGSFLTAQMDGNALPSYSFPTGKTWCIISQTSAFTQNCTVSLQIDSDTQIELQSGEYGERKDNIVWKNCVEIRIYK